MSRMEALGNYNRIKPSEDDPERPALPGEHSIKTEGQKQVGQPQHNESDSGYADPSDGGKPVSRHSRSYHKGGRA